ncbi:flagellar hook-associated family protein [Pannonibacter phragmitetus]|uniref:flagellar hook-associated family protein n=1 Tax=Pannonibacter phragmitetus TaxID=121719 RepID=UPI000B960C58|nr:flagellar hook-associated family protein [Pannonibacter phragmitetus]
MKTTYISTFTMSNNSRSLLMRQTADVAQLQVEMSSGRKADVGLDLGRRTGDAVMVRSEFFRLSAIIDTNALASSRLDVTQTALGDMLSSAENLLSTLVGVRDSNGSAVVAQSMAESNLRLLVARLNTQVSGTYVFGGINSAEAPINDYFATPASDNKAALDAAFLAEFGFTQDDPAAAGITPAQMQTFLDGAFASLFEDPQWGADWSNATNELASTVISPGESALTSLSANEKAFRQLAMAFTMIGDLGTSGLSEGTYKTMLDKAISVLGDAVAGISDIQGKTGLVQKRVSEASTRLKLQTDILNKQIISLESVNPEETAVRLNTALTQLETTYAVSARMQKLSILNYL